jgi:hemolysin III
MEIIQKKIKDPISAFTHFLGFLAAIPILIILVQKASQQASAVHIVAFALFGASLLLLYGASTVYHTLKLPAKYQAVMRRIDHMMIFVLIAGTYTPVCLIPLRGKWGWSLLILVWFFAISGIILKALWLEAPRWLSTLIYVVMGWLIVVAFVPLEKAMPWQGLALLVAGGVTYTLGAVIYALKWPKITLPNFGFHEIFHLFVMAGSAFHVIFMFQYVL